MSQPWIVPQKIDISFRYTAGPALDRFFRGLRDGVLLASRCDGCRRASFPPVSFCGRCWRPVTDQFAITGRGTVLSFSRLDRLPRALEGLALPVYLALLALDGADSRFVHLVSPAAKPLACGDPVEAVWRRERSGTIRDLEGFRVVPSPGKD